MDHLYLRGEQEITLSQSKPHLISSACRAVCFARTRFSVLFSYGQDISPRNRDLARRDPLENASSWKRNGVRKSGCLTFTFLPASGNIVRYTIKCRSDSRRVPPLPPVHPASALA